MNGRRGVEDTRLHKRPGLRLGLPVAKTCVVLDVNSANRRGDSPCHLRRLCLDDGALGHHQTRGSRREQSGNYLPCWRPHAQKRSSVLRSNAPGCHFYGWGVIRPGASRRRDSHSLWRVAWEEGEVSQQYEVCTEHIDNFLSDRFRSYWLSVFTALDWNPRGRLPVGGA